MNPLCDYFVFTDRDVPEKSVWKKIPTSIIPDYETMDAYHLSKYVKILPHKFFAEYSYSVWVDGTTCLVADLIPLVDRLKDRFIGVFNNPVHDCIYTEGNFLIYYNRVNELEIKKQLNDYRAKGYPMHAGMFECTVIIRRHNEDKCVQMMESWWKHINTYTMRDQISFPVVAWEMGLLNDGITLLGEDRNHNPRFIFEKHLKVQKYV